MLASAILLLAGAPRAKALDLNHEPGLITETVAGRQRLKDYDSIKKYGAERVGDRDRPEAQAEGLRLGNFLMFPSVSERLIYDDNIFGAAKGKVGDFRNELAPEIKVQSSLPRHALDLSLGGKIVSYAENSDQNYENVNANLSGALHFDHAHTLSASVMSAIEHEERGAATAPRNAAGPTTVFHNRATAGLTRDVGRLYGTLSATAEQWNYQSVRAIDGSMLPQSERDLDIYSAQLRAGFRFSPGYEVVAKLRGLRQSSSGLGKNDRDGFGYEAMAGLAFETSPLLRWRLLGGYGFRNFDSSAVADVATSLLEAEVQWLPTQKLTIYATARRALIDTVSGLTDGGSIQTSLKTRAEYEIFHDLVLNLNLEVRDEEFLGSARLDRTYAGGIGLDYYLSKNWALSLSYDHETRSSSDPGYDMNRNRFMVGAKLKF